MSNFYRLNFNDGSYLTMLSSAVLTEQIEGTPGEPIISVLPNFYILLSIDNNTVIEKTDLSGNVWKFERSGSWIYWSINGEAIVSYGQKRNYYLIYNPTTGKVALKGTGNPTIPNSSSNSARVLNGDTGSSQYGSLQSCVERVSSTIKNSANANIFGAVYDMTASISPDFIPVRNLTLYMMAGYKPHTFEEFLNYDSPNGSGGSFYDVGDLSETVSELYDVPDDPYKPGGESGTGGGTGSFDGTGDDIDIPGLPTLSAVDTGFITLFNPSISELKSLANYMWGDLFDLNTWKKIFADPMDAILGLSIVPVAVPNGGGASVTVGNIPTGIIMNKAAAQYVAVDCGTLNVNEYWGAYLDYDPYTKAEIYLPYIGTHPLAVDDIMGKAVHVVYHVDILSGACCAYVKCGESVLYSFVGQCSCSIPITGNDWTNVVNGALSIATAIGTMVATGGAAAPMAATAIASTSVNSMKPNVEKSGSMGGMGGMLGVQTPYLILTRPRQALPANQNVFSGYPSFITKRLSNVVGYTEIDSIHLDGIPATEQEISEIETLLKGGVIL